MTIKSVDQFSARHYAMLAKFNTAKINGDFVDVFFSYLVHMGVLTMNNAQVFIPNLEMQYYFNLPDD